MTIVVRDRLLELVMTVRLLASSPIPIYRQIVEQITFKIAAGRLRNGDRLQSVRELARALPANQNTVLKAYELLERDGLIERRHGNGTFVTATRSPLSTAQRRRAISEPLAEAAARSQLFAIDAKELHALLDEQLARLGRGKGVRHE